MLKIKWSILLLFSWQDNWSYLHRLVHCGVHREFHRLQKQVWVCQETSRHHWFTGNHTVLHLRVNDRVTARTLNSRGLVPLRVLRMMRIFWVIKLARHFIWSSDTWFDSQSVLQRWLCYLSSFVLPWQSLVHFLSFLNMGWTWKHPTRTSPASPLPAGGWLSLWLQLAMEICICHSAWKNSWRSLCCQWNCSIGATYHFYLP